MRIKIGIIGFGKIGQARYKILNRLKNICEVTRICDPSLINVKGVICSENYNDIINDKEISSVFICTPNYLNYPITKKCLIAKKNVFCEKPPTINLSQIKKIIKLENMHKNKLMYGFNHREHESIKKMKKIIDQKKLGKILWIRGRYGKSVDKDFFKSWRSVKKYAGGGILIDQGIHMLDLFMHLSGDFNRVLSSLSNLFWKGDVEDNAFIILENTKTKVTASLHSTMTQWRHLFSLEIFLEKGYLVLNGLKTSSNSYGKEVLTIAKNKNQPSVKWISEKKEIYKIEKSFEKEIKYFLSCIKNNNKIIQSNSYDALRLMTLVSKIYRK